jgi:hypothetical protein
MKRYSKIFCSMNQRHTELEADLGKDGIISIDQM